MVAAFGRIYNNEAGPTVVASFIVYEMAAHVAMGAFFFDWRSDFYHTLWTPPRPRCDVIAASPPDDFCVPRTASKKCFLSKIHRN